MKIRASMLLSLYLSLATLVPGQAQKPLTNADVVDMVKAGFEESVVLQAIESNKTAFDTSIEALVALKKAEVSETVIEAVVRAGESQRNEKPGIHTPAQSPRALPPGPSFDTAERIGKPNFSGRWEVDKARSTFKLPKGEKFTFDSMTGLVDHREPVVIMTFIRRQGQAESTITYHLRTDATETTKELGNGSKVTSKLHWEGTTLVSHSSYTLAKPKGRVSHLESDTTWTLSEDGETLMHEERIRSKRQPSSTFVFSKVGPFIAAPER